MTKEQNQIVSLTTTINKLKDGRLKIGRRNRTDHSNRSKNSNNNSSRNNSSSNNNNENKSSSIGSSKSSERFKAKWAWKKFLPKENESHSKKCNEKTYYWCKGHNLWCSTKHNATNCNLLKNMKSSDDKDADNNASSTNSNVVSFAAQMETILQE